MFCPKNSILTYIIISVLFLLWLEGLNAQSSLGYNWYINANGGVSQLYCDIQQTNSPFGKLSDETTFGYGARIGKYTGPVFSIHFQYYFSEMKGLDADSDRKFSNNLMEYQLGTVINLSNLFFRNKERTVSLYATFGFAADFFRSELRNISTNELLNSYGFSTENEGKKDKRETGFAFPIGAGLDFKLADRWYLNLESLIRFTNSDKLDARVAGPQNDAYYYTSLGISYNFLAKKPKEAIEAPPEIVIDPYANQTVDLVYELPANIKSTDEFVLKCIIHKGKIDGPGRLVQILPIGLNVLDTVIAGGKIQFINYTLYLNWDELPADSVFELSYRVKPDNIYGSLPMVSNLYLQRTGKEYKFRTTMFIEQAEDVVIEKPLVSVITRDTSSQVKDIEYRVQVRAGFKAQIPIEKLAAKYNLTVEIKEDCLGNWCHYSVGSFETYDQAKEYKLRLMKENGIRDAFIVVFFRGKRLDELSDLQEITSEAQPIRTVYKEGGVCYRVQILAMMDKSVDPETLRSMHNIEEEVNEETYNNWNKYTVGKCTTIAETKLLLNKIKEKGLKDAFIVIYKNGERVSSPN